MVLYLVFYCVSYLLCCLFMLCVGMDICCIRGEMCLVSELEWMAGLS